MAAAPQPLAQLRQLGEKKLGVPATLHEFQWDGVAFLYRSHADGVGA